MNTAKSRVKIAGFDEALQGPVEALVRALRRLGPSQGRIARQRARQALQRAVSGLQRRVDNRYPAERKAPKRKRRPRTVKQRTAELRRSGWKVVPSTFILERLSVAGIRTKCVRIPQVNPNTGYESTFKEIWAPDWALTIAVHHPTKLAACRRGIQLRKALITEIALKQQGGEE